MSFYAAMFLLPAAIVALAVLLARRDARRER
jgi:hypothetical protein